MVGRVNFVDSPPLLFSSGQDGFLSPSFFTINIFLPVVQDTELQA